MRIRRSLSQKKSKTDKAFHCGSAASRNGGATEKDSEKQAQEKQKNRIWNCKALAVFIVKMSGVFLVP